MTPTGLVLGQHIDLSECQSVADLARQIVPAFEAMGAPGLAPTVNETPIYPVFWDPGAGEDGEGGLVGPAGTPGADGTVGEDGSDGTTTIITIIGGGGTGTTLTAGDGIDITSDVVATDNDTSTYLGYSDTTPKANAIKWEDIPGYDIDRVKFISNTRSSGPKWKHTGLLAKTVQSIAGAQYPGQDIVPGRGRAVVYTTTDPPANNTWTQAGELNVLNISPVGINTGRVVLLKAVDGSWFIDAVIC